MVNLLKLNKVSFSPDKTRVIARDMSLEVNKGDFIVIVGSNGSGKSTLIKMINRHYHHSAGDIALIDKPIQDYSKKQLAQAVVTLNQFVHQSLFVNLSIEENARLLAMCYPQSATKKRGRKAAAKELAEYLREFNVKLSESLQLPLHYLSGGEQQILAFALYLRHQPQLLLLDEHTSALDPKTAVKIMAFTDDIITKRQLTCLMTTHSLDFALQYGNRLLALRDGEIIFTADAERKKQLTKADLLEYCY
ncbi:MAG: ATP-binding cassette domain-containing protein [Pseudomonadota bacterium]